jgi:hypothetical protein
MVVGNILKKMISVVGNIVKIDRRRGQLRGRIVANENSKTLLFLASPYL